MRKLKVILILFVLFTSNIFAESKNVKIIYDAFQGDEYKEDYYELVYIAKVDNTYLTIAPENDQLYNFMVKEIDTQRRLFLEHESYERCLEVLNFCIENKYDFELLQKKFGRYINNQFNFNELDENYNYLP